MHGKPARLLALFVVLGLAACAAGGAKHYRIGERAHDEGNLEAAEAAYAKAVETEPGNASYKAALEQVRGQIADRYASEAKAKEKSGDWRGASEAWGQAARVKPADKELAARRGLSALKAQNLGPDDWYEEVKKLSGEVPGNPIIEKSLAGARAKACQYHVTLGDQLTDSGDGKKAIEHYDRAKDIDAATPGLDVARFRRAQALALMQDADDRLAGGDPLEAYDLYTKALEVEALPEIRSKQAKVKPRVAAVMAKLDQARMLAQRSKFRQALEIYESLAGTKGAPSSVESELSRVKDEVSREEAERALAAAKSGDMLRAQRSLSEAAKYSSMEPGKLEAIKSAIVDTQDGRPGKAMRTLQESGADDRESLFGAAKAFAVGTAKRSFEKAKAIAKKDSAGALALLSDLGPFEDELPAIKELRKTLRAGSFTEMLDDALGAAKQGNDEEAGMLLLAALSASNAPGALRDAATEGADAIKAQQFVDAEAAFQRALSVEPRSKLAQRGIDIARLRRRDAEKQALSTIESGSGDQDKAVDQLAKALAAEPTNATARQGAKVLLARAQSGAKTLADTELAKLLASAARLSGVPSAASAPVEEGTSSLEKGDHAGAETAFGKALEAAPSLELAKLGRELSRQRMLAGLKTGARRAAEGDDAAAKTLAELLEKDPNDPEAKAALAAILEKAKTSSMQGNDAEAGHQLGLAIVAISPAPGVKVELDRGAKALAAGKMEDAEKAFSDALDLEPENVVAKLGHELAKAARVSALSAAVADAKKGGNAEQARAALERTLTMDPDGPEARKAFAELLDEARAQGKAGNDRQAASLLDAANVVSKPETARSAIGAANKLLGEGRHADAEAAYDTVLAAGDSKVAATGKEISRERRVSALVTSSRELKDGGDLDRGAKAVAELLELDPKSVEAKSAIDAAMADAERLAAAGDDKGAARLIRAAARGAREGKELEAGLIRFESGKLDDAEAELQGHDSELARRAAQLVRQRKLGTLKAGLSGGDRAAADSIRALLKQDPNNKEAQAAFGKLLEKARTAASKGDDKAAAEALEAAVIASSAPEDLAATLTVATTHLSERRYAQAERGYLDALELSRDSKVAVTGAEIAKKSRAAAEKVAVAALAKPGDPAPHAKVLQASLLVEPKSKVVEGALAQLLARAKKAAAKPDDVEAAQVLDAAAALENHGSDVIGAIAAANALFAKGSFDEAGAAFRAVTEAKGDEGEGSQHEDSGVARLGAELSRARRVQLLDRELQAAKKENDVLRQSTAVQKILELDPENKQARELSKKLKGAVLDSRLAAAKREKEFGRLGVAYVYLKRTIALEPGNSKAKAELAAIEGSLKSKLDLIVVVDKVARQGVSDSACKGLEGQLREVVMEDGSKKQDLGAYILSKDWTAAVERGDKEAPAVNGLLTIGMTSCQSGSSVGKVKLEWALLTPAANGAAIAKGSLDAELPAGLLPRDEQDGEGNNARRMLSKRAGKALLEKLGENKGAIDLWLLTLAEHGVRTKDSALTADAWARLELRRPSSIDPVRVAEVEKYLSVELQ